MVPGSQEGDETSGLVLDDIGCHKETQIVVLIFKLVNDFFLEGASASEST